jgi:hypothetical protein
MLKRPDGGLVYRAIAFKGMLIYEQRDTAQSFLILLWTLVDT